MLKGKNIVLGVTGGIAAYKAADVVSRLKKQGANVYVIMTKNSKAFVSPLTFQSISQNYVVSDMFEDPKTWDVEHIALAKRADLFLVVPTTANVIGKIANGIADDMLTTTIMATEAPVYFALAMNTKMYTNPIFRENVRKLESYGYHMIEADSGRLACGDVGAGKLAQPEEIVSVVVDAMTRPQPLKGKQVLVTAGPTIEPIDPVRYITNHSTGKMGYAIAAMAKSMGAEVTLVSGPTSLETPRGVKRIDVKTTREMFDAVMAHQDHEIIIKAAAPADYKPVAYSEHKIKKQSDLFTIEMDRNPDILRTLGSQKQEGQILVGFAAETENIKEYATRKLNEKHLDMIVANNVGQKDAGFGTDTNIITLYDAMGQEVFYEKMSKDQVAEVILERIVQLMK